MITEKDLQEAIAECQGQRNPNANTCIKLAAFLTLQRELFAKDTNVPITGYSFSPGPESTEKGSKIGNYGSSDFLTAVDGKDAQNVLLVMDELMDTMQVLQPRIYDSVMRKIQNI